MILSYTKKTTKEDELDCGVADIILAEIRHCVYNSLAEKDMCLPFLYPKR